MTKVYISFGMDDKPDAIALAGALKAHKLSPMLGDDVPPGERWIPFLHHAVNRSEAVICLWSPRSIRSEFVRAEARAAIAQEKYFPVLLEATKLDEGYTANQWVDLSAWDRTSSDHPAILGLVRVIRKLKVNSRLYTGHTRTGGALRLAGAIALFGSLGAAIANWEGAISLVCRNSFAAGICVAAGFDTHVPRPNSPTSPLDVEPR